MGTQNQKSKINDDFPYNIIKAAELEVFMFVQKHVNRSTMVVYICKFHYTTDQISRQIKLWGY